VEVLAAVSIIIIIITEGSFNSLQYHHTNYNSNFLPVSENVISFINGPLTVGTLELRRATAKGKKHCYDVQQSIKRLSESCF